MLKALKLSKWKNRSKHTRESGVHAEFTSTDADGSPDGPSFLPLSGEADTDNAAPASASIAPPQVNVPTLKLPAPKGKGQRRKSQLAAPAAPGAPSSEPDAVGAAAKKGKGLRRMSQLPAPRGAHGAPSSEPDDAGTAAKKGNKSQLAAPGASAAPPSSEPEAASAPAAAPPGELPLPAGPPAAAEKLPLPTGPAAAAAASTPAPPAGPSAAAAKPPPPFGFPIPAKFAEIRPPPGAGAGDAPAAVGCELADPAERAVSLRQLRRILAAARALGAAERWKAVGRGGRAVSARTMCAHDIVEHLVLPATQHRGCSLVEQVAAGAQRTRWLVSHSWNQPLMDVLRGVTAHARDRAIDEDAPVYWLAWCAVRLKAGSPELRTPPGSAQDVAHRARVASEGTLTVLDSIGHTLVSSPWVAFEAYCALTDTGGRHLHDVYVAAPSTERSEAARSGVLQQTVMAAALALTQALPGAAQAGGNAADAHAARLVRPDPRPAGSLDGLGAADARALRPSDAASSRTRSELRFQDALMKQTREFTFSEAASAAVEASPRVVGAAELVATDAYTILQSLGGADAVHALEKVIRARFGVVPGLSRAVAAGDSAELRAQLALLSDAEMRMAALTVTFAQLPPVGAVAALAHALPPNLVRLQLMHVTGTRELAPAVASLAARGQLRHLALCACQLDDEDISALCLVHRTSSPISHLRSIDLRENAFGDTGAQALATALAHVASGEQSALTFLDLSQNPMLGDVGLSALAGAISAGGGAPGGAGQGAARLAELRILNVEHCPRIGDAGATALGDALGASTSLKELRMARTGVGAEGARALAVGIGAHTTLELLRLSRTRQIGDVGAASIARSLTSTSALAHLDLADAGIGAEGARAIAEALKSGSALRLLDLSANSLGAKGGAALASGLRQNSSLEQLRLAHCRLGDAGAEALGPAVGSSCLRLLNLAVNDIGDAGTSAFLGGLVEAAPAAKKPASSDASEAPAKHVQKTLARLFLDGNAIGDDGATAVGKHARSMQALRVLSLGDNRIGGPGASELARGVRATRLESLELADNALGGRGAAALAEAGIGRTRSLRDLGLAGNTLGDEGAVAIAKAVRGGRLLAVRLADNRIGTAGAAALGKAIADPVCVLERLDLGNNLIDDAGAAAVGKGLQTNARLLALDLGYNGHLGDDGAKALSEALRGNSTLTRLDVAHGGISPSGADALDKALHYNAALETLVT